MQDTATYACVLQWGIQAYSVNTNEDTFNLGFANRKSLEISDTQNDCRDRALQKERVFRFWTHRNDCRNILWVAVIVTNLSYEHTCHTSPANETCYSKHKEIILCWTRTSWLLQGGEDAQDALGCRSLLTKAWEPLTIGHFSGKRHIKITHSLHLHHPVGRSNLVLACWGVTHQVLHEKRSTIFHVRWTIHQLYSVSFEFGLSLFRWRVPPVLFPPQTMYDRFHQYERYMTVSTENDTPLKFTKSRNPDSLVSRGKNSSWNFALIWICTEEFFSIWWIWRMHLVFPTESVSVLHPKDERVLHPSAFRYRYTCLCNHSPAIHNRSPRSWHGKPPLMNTDQQPPCHAGPPSSTRTPLLPRW